MVWCLICEQRPAQGTLRRVFADSMAPVILDVGEPVPQVCEPCADAHHGTPGAVAHDRPTVWEFTLDFDDEEDHAL